MAGNTAQRVFDLIEPTVRAMGLVLWDVRFLKEGASWYLRVFIDRAGGVGIEDCADVSRAIDPILDEADPIAQSYYLEVSSPGLSRELTRPAHFAAMWGAPVIVRLYRAEDGRREFSGRLRDADETGITLDTDAGPLTFARAAVAAVRLDDEGDLPDESDESDESDGIEEIDAIDETDENDQVGGIEKK